MDEIILNTVLLIGVGALNLYYATKFLKDLEYAQKYAETSPKAFLWRKAFGVEKTTKIIKHIFAPLGIILGAGFILMGIWIYSLNYM
ncbi:hypothetical protein [Methanolobus sp.]|jgi:hypothetical protein|uniref:hypothetical protein n=1 Tax=Methanolobus sp. TaxID=1874737 RepID=UPI0025D947E9|nr:hypothetical protein [Methanolobus sp.]